mgnify:CR=1 FL=1
MGYLFIYTCEAKAQVLSATGFRNRNQIIDSLFALSTSNISINNEIALLYAEKGKELLDEIEYFRGNFVLLWHNKFFSGYKYGEWKEIFVQIIREIRKRGGEIILPTEIYNQYRLNK